LNPVVMPECFNNERESVSDEPDLQEKLEATVAALIEAGVDMPQALMFVAALFENIFPGRYSRQPEDVSEEESSASFDSAVHMAQEFRPVTLAIGAVKACRIAGLDRGQAMVLFLEAIDIYFRDTE
jgi:hypothetical protein